MLFKDHHPLLTEGLAAILPSPFAVLQPGYKPRPDRFAVLVSTVGTRGHRRKPPFVAKDWLQETKPPACKWKCARPGLIKQPSARRDCVSSE